MDNNSKEASHHLESYYSGDQAWNNYVSLCREEYPDFEQKQTELIDMLKGHTDLAIVIYQKMGSNSTLWVHRGVPALDGLSAIDCLKAPNLVNRLREFLLRMPV